MCFIIHTKEEPVAKVAKSDITVYKVLAVNWLGRLFAPFRGDRYKKNVIYKVTLGKPEAELDGKGMSFSYSIEEGFHSIIDRVKASYFHAPKEFGRPRLYEAVIPKGSLYHINEKSKICISDGIIIKRRIKR